MSKQKTPGLYSTVEAARICGMKFRTVDYWRRRGIVVPQRPTTGTGVACGYNLEDLAVLGAVKAVADAQHSGALLRQVARTVRTQPYRRFVRVRVSAALEMELDIGFLRRRIHDATVAKRRNEPPRRATKEPKCDAAGGSALKKGGRDK